MVDTRRKLARVWWAVDRMLGGRQRPTWFQRFIARHPLGVGLALGVPSATVLAVLVTLSEGTTGDAVVGACFGGTFGLVYGLTALVERYRQRRLLRLGLWDGS